jgi:transcriptional regulator GlxA family with amidase domain
MSTPRRILFLLLPQVHALDLAGPVQAFHEAGQFGAEYQLTYCAGQDRVVTAQGFVIADLQPPPDVGEDDWVIVPGLDSSCLQDAESMQAEWLRSASHSGARIASVCSGSWALAHAGLLDGRRCTTHWKLVASMQKQFPRAMVQDNRLFVTDGNIMTSAGVSSGIDMALAMIEQDHGPLVTAQVAREMVVYLRRDGSSSQKSIYVDYRTHLHPGVHQVQDWMVAHPEQRIGLGELAARAGMSARNLSRVFKMATGIGIKAFDTRLKLEIAGRLLHDPHITIEQVASRCGFADARQLRRLWKQTYGVSPSAWQRQEPA